MAADKVAIANKSLALLGALAITAFDQAGSEEAAAINEVYDDILEEVLSEHPWSFATKRIALVATVPADTSRTIDDTEYTPVVITAATAADPVVITAAAHGLVDGDWIKITAVGGMTELNGEFFIVDDATTNTFSINDTLGEDVDGTAFGAYTTGGQIQKAPEMVTVDTYVPVVYEKPDDYVRVFKKSHSSARIEVERDKIISDVVDLKIIYTYLNTDVTQYFPQFIQALATRLAAEICFRVTNSTTKVEGLMKLYYDVVLPKAMSVDSMQSTPQQADDGEWLASMMDGSGGRWVTGAGVWHPVG